MSSSSQHQQQQQHQILLVCQEGDRLECFPAALKAYSSASLSTPRN